jgi:hypothetical protein
MHEGSSSVWARLTCFGFDGCWDAAVCRFAMKMSRVAVKTHRTLGVESCQASPCWTCCFFGSSWADLAIFHYFANDLRNTWFSLKKAHLSHLLSVHKLLPICVCWKIQTSCMFCDSDDLWGPASALCRVPSLYSVILLFRETETLFTKRNIL